MVMVRVVLLGVPFELVVLVVFDGGPKSHGDELIVRTSRFLAEPKTSEKKKEKQMKNEPEKWRYTSWDGIIFSDCSHLLDKMLYFSSFSEEEMERSFEENVTFSWRKFRPREVKYFFLSKLNKFAYNLKKNFLFLENLVEKKKV